MEIKKLSFSKAWYMLMNNPKENWVMYFDCGAGIIEEVPDKNGFKSRNCFGVNYTKYDGKQFMLMGYNITDKTSYCYKLYDFEDIRYMRGEVWDYYIVCDWGTFVKHVEKECKKMHNIACINGHLTQLYTFNVALQFIRYDGVPMTRKTYKKKCNLVFEKVIIVEGNPVALVALPMHIDISEGIYSGKIYVPTQEDKDAKDWYAPNLISKFQNNEIIL